MSVRLPDRTARRSRFPAGRGTLCGFVLAAVLAFGTAEAFASPGCDAVNAGGFDGTNSNPGTPTTDTTIAGFAVGDRITFSITYVGDGTWGLGAGTNNVNLHNVNATDTVLTRSYTVTGNLIDGQSDTTLSQVRVAISAGGSITVAATCTAAAADNTDSQKLRALQILASKMAAQTSGAAITGAIGGAIDDAFNGGGNPINAGPNGMTFNFAAAAAPSEVVDRAHAATDALAYGGPVTKAPPRRTVERQWSAWADVRGTGWDRNNGNADLKGNQINVTAGIGRKLTPDLLVGVVGGYENFRYDSAQLAGRLKGNGWTVGGYAAWRFARHWRFDAAVAWSDIAYDAAAGTASGAFGGQRWLASGGLTGRYALGTLIVEPSAKVYALWERQHEWTDSLGTVQAARSFSAGRVATGGKAIYPWMAGDLTVAPYFGAYADWRFSSDDALPAGQPVVGIGDGWSGRVTGGVTMSKSGGGTLALGGDYGGLGANYKVWTAHARVHWPF